MNAADDFLEEANFIIDETREGHNSKIRPKRRFTDSSSQTWAHKLLHSLVTSASPGEKKMTLQEELKKLDYRECGPPVIGIAWGYSTAHFS